MGKNIAVFADGTGNTVGKHDSNVLKLCKRANLLNPKQQLVIYDPGVGTRTPYEELECEFPKDSVRLIKDSFESSWVRMYAVWLLGLFFGYGTERNIKQLYGELVKSYDPGDHVYIFGFSRGAFTARSLAGLIYRCGLLRCDHKDKQCDHTDKIEEAYKLYRKHFEQAKSSKQLRERKRDVENFRRKYSHPCNIRFLGIFDTVKSVGYLRPKNLPHTRHNPIVQTVRHALALGEQRSFYLPTTWGGLDGDTRPAVYVPACWNPDCNAPIQWQDVEEVWFAGCHSDVGGGYPRDESSPADVSLRWMLEAARAHGLQISGNSEVSELDTTVNPDHLHDEMNRRGTVRDWICRTLWRCAERIPRRDLENEPPPPRKYWRFKPAGPRDACAPLRRGRATVHSTAKSDFVSANSTHGAQNVRFIDTIPNQPQVAAEDCGCRLAALNSPPSHEIHSAD
jgi:uncharacterized protein (DUF2235 family)